MYSRAIYFVAFSVMMLARANAQHETAAPAIGDRVFVRLEGALAQEYAARSGMPHPQMSGFRISVIATIEQRQPDGKYQIEHQMTTAGGDKPRMITLTAIVAPTDFAIEIAPKNTPVYASPAAYRNGDKPTLTQTEQRSLRLTLSKLDGVKLLTWALVDEFGK